jgi:nucleoprotein TPR
MESQDQIKYLNDQLTGLRDVRNKQDLKMQEYQEQIRDLKNEHIGQVDDLKIEINSQKRLVELYKQSSEDLQTRITELQQQLDKVRQNYVTERNDLEQSIGKWKKSYNDSQEEVERLKLQIVQKERFEEATTSTSERAGALLNKGISNSDMYNKYIKSEEELLKQRNECKRLNDVLNSILKQIEEKAPVIQEQREEYERIMSAHVVLTKRYQKLTQEHDAAFVELKQLRIIKTESEKSIQALTSENSDLSLQVQKLLLECREHKQRLSSLGVQQFSNNLSTQSSNLTSSSAVIDENLVTFKDITELQEKNRQLLRAIHELKSEKEQRENELKRSMSEEVEEKLRQTKEQLDKMRAERENAMKQIHSIARQRDMYKKLHDELSKMQQLPEQLGTSESRRTEEATSSHYITPKELQKIQEDYLKNRQMLEDRTNQIMEQLSASNSELARKNSEISFLSERLKSIQSSIDSYQKEISNYRESNDKLTRLHIDLQNELAKANNISGQLREDMKKVEMEKISAESAKNYAQDRAERLMEHIENLKKENVRLEEFFKKLHETQMNLDTREQLSKKQISLENETLKSEIAQLRKDIEDERTLNKNLKLQFEQSQKQIHEQNEARAGEITSLKAELVAAKAIAERLEDDKRTLQMKLSTSDSRLSSILDKQILGQSESVTTSSSDEGELQVQLSRAQHEIELLTETLRREKEAAVEYQKIASSNETSLAELTTAYEQYRTVTDKKLEQATLRVAKLEAALNEAREETKGTLSEFEVVRSELDTERQKAQKQQQSLVGVAKESEISLAESEKRINILKEDLKRHVDLWRSAQENYEQELLKHASDVELLNSYKEKLNKIESENIIAQKKAQNAEQSLTTLQESWKQQEEILKQQLQDVDKRMRSLADENTLLHSQMEQLNILNKKLKLTATSDTAELSKLPTVDEAKQVEELRELIRILKRDKEILASKLSIAEQEARRDSQKLEETLRVLEDARMQLQTERHQKPSSQISEEVYNNLNEQLNIFRESNRTLRLENQNSAKVVEEWKERVNILQAELKPVQQQLDQARTENSLLRSEIEQLRSDVQKWQDRSKNLLEKYKQIDPDEHKRVQEELDTVKKENAAIKSEVDSLKKELETSKSLSQQTSSLQKKIDQLQKDVAAANTAKEQVEQQLSAEQEEVRKGTDKLSRAMKLLRELRAQKAAFETERQEQEEKIKALVNEKGQLELRLNALKSMKKVESPAASTTQQQQQQPPATPVQQTVPPPIVEATPAPPSTSSSTDNSMTALLRRKLERSMKASKTKRTSEQMEEPVEDAPVETTATPPTKKQRIEESVTVEQTQTTTVEQPQQQEPEEEEMTEAPSQLLQETKPTNIEEPQEEGDNDSERKTKRRPKIHRPTIMTTPTREETSSPQTTGIPDETSQQQAEDLGDVQQEEDESTSASKTSLPDEQNAEDLEL